MIPYAREVGALLGLLLLMGVGWLAYDYGHGKGMAKRAGELEALQAAFAKQGQKWADARTEASEKARELELAEARRMAEAGEHYERGKRDAQAVADDLVAGLRAGNAELREHWQGCLATSELPQAAADPGRADGGAGLRQADLRAVLHIAGLCEAHVRGLQRVVPN